MGAGRAGETTLADVRARLEQVSALLAGQADGHAVLAETVAAGRAQAADGRADD